MLPSTHPIPLSILKILCCSLLILFFIICTLLPLFHNRGAFGALPPSLLPQLRPLQKSPPLLLLTTSPDSKAMTAQNELIRMAQAKAIFGQLWQIWGSELPILKVRTNQHVCSCRNSNVNTRTPSLASYRHSSQIS